jgi:predicted ATPase
MDNKYIKFLEQFDVEKQVNYIRKIRFPHYKNLVTDTEIHFDKPFTVLVGPNGSGKSSVLHAIYGCPLDKSLGDYWFSTALDPIDEGKGITNRFIYEFKPKDYPEFVEVCKSRVKRSKSDTKNANMDNWETTKPMKMHGMKRMPPYRSKHKEIRSLERWSPVIKDVEYIDFRSDLSAFDKFFYFGFYREGKKIKSKQDFLRSRSSNLKNHIENDDGEDLIWRRKAQKDSALDKVTDMELQWINLILGKSYTGAKIIKHALFNNAGYSIQFTCEDKKYSEAAAGSGEVSVVNCVTRVMRAKKGSLVLLDEPEVSLHPGAQSELRDFLLAMIQQKQHQVVISTHSEQFVKGLPATCIKLFVEDKKDKRFHIIHECSSDQAFLRIGGTKDAKRKVYVEDKTAKLIVEAALTELDEMYNVKYSVIVHPGGASARKRPIDR